MIWNEETWKEKEKLTSTKLFGHGYGKVLLVIAGNGLGAVDVNAHEGYELDAHALALEIPRVKHVAPQLFVFKVLKEAHVLLRGNLPVTQTFAKGVVFRLLDGRFVENVVLAAVHGQPAVLLLVGRFPLEHLEVGVALPLGQGRGAPVGVFAGRVLGVTVFGVGHVRQDGTEVQMDPGHHGLVDDVGRDNVMFGMHELGADNGQDGIVLNVDNIVVNLDVESFVVEVVVGGGEAVVFRSVDNTLGIALFVVDHLVQEIQVLLIVSALQPHDLVKDAAVGHEVALNEWQFVS